MPKKSSCEIKTRTIHQPQKNGDIYVIERQTRYDPAKKYNVVISRYGVVTLVGPIVGAIVAVLVYGAIPW